MSPDDDDVALCRQWLAEERKCLTDLDPGALWIASDHGRSEDVTERHRAHHRAMIEHWTQELAKLGAIDP